MGNNYFADYSISIQDINGDGNSDIFELKPVYHPASLEYPAFWENEIRVYNFLSNYEDNTGFLESPFNNETYFSFNTYSAWDASKALFGDFNGDGKADIIANGYVRYIYNQDKGKTVAKIYNGLNDYVQFNYETIPQDDNYSADSVASPYIPFHEPIQVVSSVVVPDGIGGTNTTNYLYFDAAYHPEVGFVGFGKIATINSLGIKQETKIANTILTSGSNKHFYQAPARSKTIKVGSPDEVISQTDITTTSVLRNNNKSFFTYESTVVQNNYLNETKTVSSNYIDAATANITNASVKYFDATASIPVRTDSIYKTYTTFGSWHVASRVSSEKSISTQKGNNPYTREVNYTYDNYGRLTQSISDPSKAMAVTSVYSSFNIFGQPGSIAVSATNTNRTAGITYDTKGRFVISQTNALSHTSTMQYDSRWGKLTSETGIDGQTVEYEYDAFGRLKRYWDVYDNISYYKYSWYSGSSPQYAVYYAKDSIAGAQDKLRYYDIKNRNIREVIEQISGYGQSDFEFNTHGQLYRFSKPMFSSSTAKWITFTYDGYGRKLTEQEQTIDPTLYSYSGKTITITNPAGQSTITTLNAAGQTILVEDDLGGTIAYKYHSNGNPDTVTTNGNSVLITYNDYGLRSSLSDPDAGVSSYTYDALGQLVWEEDAEGQERTRSYNNLGQLTSMTGDEGTTTYTYSTSGVSKEKLTQITGWDSNTLTYSYDSFGRLSSDALFINSESKTLSQSYTYDSFGRLSRLTYPSGFAIQYLYSNGGILEQIKRYDTNEAIWSVEYRGPAGQPTRSIYGNGMTERYTYDNYDNIESLEYLYSSSSSASSVSTMSLGEVSSSDAIVSSVTYYKTTYSWDAESRNLLSRTNTVANLTESFEYDELNRLTGSTIGSNTIGVDYYLNGNIDTKDDAGEYSYGSQPHAVSGVAAPSGSAISSTTQDIVYNPFNKVASISEGINSMTINYSPTVERCMQKEYESSVLKRTIYYFHNYEEIATVGSSFPTKNHYIYSPDGLVAIMKQVRNTKTLYYAARDHLGSVMALYTETRAKVEESSYDAWGRRRNPTNWTYTSVPPPTITRHGFTNHEHLDKYSLINMNGRVYDPVLGRFLSPDPVTQDPNNTQNHNKYSYVLNNPLKFTDPSGYRSQRVYKLRAPDMDGVNYAINMDREAQWAAMHSGGDEFGAFMAALFGVGTGGGGGGLGSSSSAAPDGGSAVGDGGPDGGDGNISVGEALFFYSIIQFMPIAAITVTAGVNCQVLVLGGSFQVGGGVLLLGPSSGTVFGFHSITEFGGDNWAFDVSGEAGVTLWYYFGDFKDFDANEFSGESHTAGLGAIFANGALCWAKTESGGILIGKNYSVSFGASIVSFNYQTWQTYVW